MQNKTIKTNTITNNITGKGNTTKSAGSSVTHTSEMDPLDMKRRLGDNDESDPHPSNSPRRFAAGFT